MLRAFRLVDSNRMTPRITVQFDPENDHFALMAECHNANVPAGPRLFRAPPHPRIKFNHDTKAAADADADSLRRYLGALTLTKNKNPKARKEGA